MKYAHQGEGVWGCRYIANHAVDTQHWTAWTWLTSFVDVSRDRNFFKQTPSPNFLTQNCFFKPLLGSTASETTYAVLQPEVL